MIIRRQLITVLAAIAVLTSTAIPSFASDREVRIVNNTGFTMVQFYGSNKGTNSWQEDILGADVLRSGHSFSVNFDDGTGYCKFDFKAVFDDGDVLIRKNINICEITSFTYE